MFESTFHHICPVFYILGEICCPVLPRQRRTGLSLLMLQTIEWVNLLLGQTYTLCWSLHVDFHKLPLVASSSSALFFYLASSAPCLFPALHNHRHCRFCSLFLFHYSSLKKTQHELNQLKKLVWDPYYIYCDAGAEMSDELRMSALGDKG